MGGSSKPEPPKVTPFVEPPAPANPIPNFFAGRQAPRSGYQPNTGTQGAFGTRPPGPLTEGYEQPMQQPMQSQPLQQQIGQMQPQQPQGMPDFASQPAMPQRVPDFTTTAPMPMAQQPIQQPQSPTIPFSIPSQPNWPQFSAENPWTPGSLMPRLTGDAPASPTVTPGGMPQGAFNPDDMEKLRWAKQNGGGW